MKIKDDRVALRLFIRIIGRGCCLRMQRLNVRMRYPGRAEAKLYCDRFGCHIRTLRAKF